jgi:hypothetical protein
MRKNKIKIINYYSFNKNKIKLTQIMKMLNKIKLIKFLISNN